MEKVLDLTYLNDISGGDADFVKEMLELFNKTTANELDGFDKLLESENWTAVGSLAHKLKSPIQMLGAKELFELVRNLEYMGKEKTDIEKIPVTIEKIKTLSMQLITEINETLKTM